MVAAAHQRLTFAFVLTLVMGCAADNEPASTTGAEDTNRIYRDVMDNGESETDGDDVARSDDTDEGASDAAGDPVSEVMNDVSEPDTAMADTAFEDTTADTSVPDVEPDTVEPCLPDDDETLCQRAGTVCGPVELDDGCGITRTVPSCGSCQPGEHCVDGTSCAATFAWRAGDWGLCTEPCDGGSHNRTVTCIDLRSGAPVSDSSCPARKPASSESCNNQGCACFYGDGLNCTGNGCEPESPGFFDNVRNGGSGWGACIIVGSNCECRARGRDVYCADATSQIGSRSCYIGTL